jgi:CsoR family transcriptional regulator, copper-sensing transcriptional repressor
MNEWTERKGAVLGRLRRVEGQVRAVAGMVEREEDCERVVQQLAAARKALDRTFYDLIACLTQRELAEGGVRSAAVLKRLAQVNDLLARYG